MSRNVSYGNSVPSQHRVDSHKPPVVHERCNPFPRPLVYEQMVPSTTRASTSASMLVVERGGQAGLQSCSSPQLADEVDDALAVKGPRRAAPRDSLREAWERMQCFERQVQGVCGQDYGLEVRARGCVEGGDHTAALRVLL
ncbi:hypothetical protein CTA1_13144 [Colletotrichum tanaceti]|uniref:Uncharacterized protein n=1 Tax=Colletotrichum tanaceti TaxID=1306861 RepID=A0A4U6X4A9_9PEZI|nr:hypothetical protein CTA1_13144 [Colletotrichum tanaceti]